MEVSPTKEMRFDVCNESNGPDPLYAHKELNDIKSFRTYPGTPGGQLNRDKVVKYIIMVYSYDSFLNKKPMKPLEERKCIAHDIAGFKRIRNGRIDANIRTKLFDLEENKHIYSMVMDFLIYQNHPLWADICVTEQEYEEYLRKRLAPIKTFKDDPKKELDASEKKDKLREACKRMRADLIGYYTEFFLDHTDVRKKLTKEFKTLETLARPS